LEPPAGFIKAHGAEISRTQKSPSKGASSQDDTLRWLGYIVVHSREAEKVNGGQLRSKTVRLQLLAELL